MTAGRETTFTFQVDDTECIGIVHMPAQINKSGVGVIILVGGPQYRVGPHRQYVHLARHLARNGIPAMRFDFRGVGDSDGPYPGFENVGDDLNAAVAAFREHVPAVEKIIPWGLCEGASSILLTLSDHPDIAGAILANPWVRTRSGLAKAHLKHYYGKRFLDIDFWKRLFTGKANPFKIIKSLSSTVQNLFRPKEKATGEMLPFPDRMAKGLNQFNKPVLLVQSGNDLVAREFDDLTRNNPSWDALNNENVTRYDLTGSDHTFSAEKWRREVAEQSETWIRQLYDTDP